MIVVKKFGGSSVATLDHIKKVANFIKRTKGDNQIVVVVSAMGKTTNALIEKAKTLSTAPNPRELDQLLSTGELQSVALLAIELHKLGLNAFSMSGKQAGIRTNSRYGRAFITKIDTKNILRHLECGDIVVVAGFQGFAPNGDTTTLGRGGSDTTAVALASALNAQCEIYSDIDCIYSCDPRYHNTRHPLHTIDYDYMLEMAFYGTKAMEVRAVELAKKYNVEIYTGRSLKVDKTKGTMITSTKEQFENVKIINISIKDDMQFISLSQPNSTGENIFVFFALHGLNLTMFNSSFYANKPIYQFSLENSFFESHKKALRKCGKIKALNGAIITLVGSGFATHPIFVSKVIELLKKNEIEIIGLNIGQLNMTFFIKENQINNCVELFANKFKL